MKHPVLFLCIYCGMTYSEHCPKCHNFLLTSWSMTLTNKEESHLLWCLFTIYFLHHHCFIDAPAMLKHAWAGHLWRFSGCFYSGNVCVMVIHRITQSSFMLTVQPFLVFLFALSHALLQGVLSSGICSHSFSWNCWSISSTVAIFCRLFPNVDGDIFYVIVAQHISSCYTKNPPEIYHFKYIHPLF